MGDERIERRSPTRGLRVEGRCDITGELDVAQLRELIGSEWPTTFDDTRIEIVDLLAWLRVHAGAEVLAVATPDGELVAVRIGGLLSDPDAHVSWGVPMRLHASSLSARSGVEIGALCFSTFADFVSGIAPTRAIWTTP